MPLKNGIKRKINADRHRNSEQDITDSLSEMEQPDTQDDELTLSDLRSPRAAAVYGIVFTLLSVTIMLLVQELVTVSPADVTKEWLKANSKAASLGLLLVPFNGIAFLWFTGVLRDWLEDRRGHFFSTVFFGSGILFVGMLFVWGAALGALFGTYTAVSEKLMSGDIYYFGFIFMNEVLGDYALRVVGVYMSSVATLWIRADVMPRWLIIITYIVSAGFMVFAGKIPESRFIFPGWVFLVSVNILILNYRRTHSV